MVGSRDNRSVHDNDDDDDADWGLLSTELKDVDTSSIESSSNNSSNNNNLRVAGAIFGTCVFCTVGLTAPFVLSRSALPYMATPGKKIHHALRYLDKGQKGIFVDLGSGDGEAVYQAAKLGYTAIGVELNFTLWAFSSLRRALFWSSFERERSTFVWSNFFDYNLKDANTIFLFGVAPMMKSLSQKIKSEVKPKTDILSYRFALPLADDGENGLLEADIIYDRQEMRIYRCR